MTASNDQFGWFSIRQSERAGSGTNTRWRNARGINHHSGRGTEGPAGTENVIVDLRVPIFAGSGGNRDGRLNFE
jgi:hypothetical protein